LRREGRNVNYADDEEEHSKVKVILRGRNGEKRRKERGTDEVGE
jgi:hypothetical protein